jgi:hypothetical protein
MPYDATQTFGGYGSDSSSTFDSTKPFGGYEVDQDLPDIWDFPGGLKPGEKESPANPDNKGKNFLADFAKSLGSLGNQNSNKYREQAEQSAYQTGKQSSTSSGNVDKIAPDISLYTPPPPTIIPGSPGKKGIGGTLVRIAGAALAPFTGGASIPIAGAASELFS